MYALTLCLNIIDFDEFVLLNRIFSYKFCLIITWKVQSSNCFDYSGRWFIVALSIFIYIVTI